MPEVRGWNNMPVWAKILSAPVYADELAVKPLNSLMGLFKTGADMYGDYNAQDAVAKLAQMGGSTDTAAFKPEGYMSADQRVKFEELRKKKLAEQYASEALPVKSTAESLLVDPEFRNDPEALKEFQSRPAFWTGAKQLNNPNIVDAIKGFAESAKGQEVKGATGKAIGKNQANPFAEMDSYNLGQIVSDKNVVDNIKAIAELGGKERSALATTGFFQDVANASSATDPVQAYNAFASAVAKNPYVDEKSQKVGLDMMKQKFPEMKFEKAFTGNKEEQQLKGINPLTGATVDIGSAGLPSAPKIDITNNLPAQENAFSKGVGEANAKAYAGAVDQKSKSEKAITTIDDYLNAAKNTYSGVGAHAQYLAAKANPLRTKAQQRAVENYEIATTKSKEMAMDILNNFSGAISEGERKFSTEMANNPKMDRASQQRLADIAKRNHQTQIKKAETLIKSVETEPVRSNINKTLKESQPIAPAGTRVPKKGGGFYTSDGKGGWQ